MTNSRYTLRYITAAWKLMLSPQGTQSSRRLATGVDGMHQENFAKNLTQQIQEILRKIHRPNSVEGCDYRFAPLLELEKPKDNGATRLVYVPRIRDQLVFRLMHDDIVSCCNALGLSSAPEPPATVVARLRQAIACHPTMTHIVKTDISQFYNSIPRERVLDMLSDLQIEETTRRLLISWSRNVIGRPAWVRGRQGDKPLLGLPQGVSISAPLSEMWAGRLDNELCKSKGVLYFRYIDDILLLGSQPTELEEAYVHLMDQATKLDLTLSAEKTIFSRLERGVPWLGLIHSPTDVRVDPNRRKRWIKRLAKSRREFGDRIAESKTLVEKRMLVQAFVENMWAESRTSKNFRIRWYAFVDNTDQWRELDKFMHSLIHSVYRQAGIPIPNNLRLPSIYLAIMRERRLLRSSSQQTPNKGDAPTVSTAEKGLKAPGGTLFQD